jgi:DNA polymerase-1
MADKRPLLILIDGHAAAYRHYHAMPSDRFHTRAGEPTGAIYGFTRMLLDVLEEQPAYLAVSFDRGLSGREELFGDYKGTRDKMPDDLQVQMPRIEDMVRAFNIPILSIEGYEADDIIGTVSVQAVEQGCEIRIITGDRDLLQLLNEHVRVQLPVRGDNDQVWDEAAYREKYAQLTPAQLVELKGLMGDSSDNIPGVKGIGEKTAFKLLSIYATLEAIYENLSEIEERYRKLLVAEREMAFLSRNLATIRRDAPIQLDLAACAAHEFDPQKVVDLFDQLEFGDTLRKRLGKVADSFTALTDQRSYEERPPFVPDHTIVIESHQLEALVKILNAAKLIAFDTETTAIDKMTAELVGISLSVDGRHGYYIPVGHISPNVQPSLFGGNEAPQQLPLQSVIDAIRPALTNPAIAKIAHNAQYDLVILRRYGIDVSPIVEDTMLAEWVFDPGSYYLGLKGLARVRLGIKMRDIEELIGSGAKQISMARVSIEEAAAYATADAVVTYRLLPHLQQDLQNPEMPKARKLYEELEIPLIPVLANMEMAGVKIDTAFLAELSQEMTRKQNDIAEQVYEMAGERFNISSYQQLNVILFEKLHLPTAGLSKLKTGGFSLTAAVLDDLAERIDHPILRLIMAHRSLSKLLGTYIDALPLLVNPRTGRVHTSFNQTGAVTGRLSSSNPNLQNIPIRTEEGRRIRQAFIAEAGNLLLSVDYSQIELRILAHYSGDDTLRQAFEEGQDIHRATAAKVFNIAPEQVTFEQRRFAKTVNFGLMYGMGAFRLARDTELTLADAEAFIKAYFDNFPGVRDYLQATKDFAREKGYVETLFGRRRSFAILQQGSGKRVDEQRAEREAINMPIQGTAADIMKKAMIEVDRRLREGGYRARMLLQVHDELLLEVPEEESEEVKTLVVEIMETAGDVLQVPVIADASLGVNWAVLT